MVPPQPVDVAIAVVERDGHFLVGLRPEGKSLAGLAEFPGGRVEVGESAEQAAIRECREETGISVRVEFEYPPQVQAYHHATVSLRFFACHPLMGGETPPAPFRWVSRAGLADLEFPEGNAQLLAQLIS